MPFIWDSVRGGSVRGNSVVHLLSPLDDGVSHSPCAETFCGPSAGSELETQAVSAELNRVGSTLKASVTVHSYGNMWMHPWGNTVNYAGVRCDFAADDAEMVGI